MPRIPISTDPTAALQGLNQVKRKLEDLGQAGKKVSDIDLSMPGLGEAAEHAKTMQRNFEELLRVHKSLAAGIRASGQQGVPVWDVDFNKLYPSSHEKAARAREQVFVHAARGTPYAVAPGGGGGGGDAGTTVIPGAMSIMKKLLPIAGVYGAGKMTMDAMSFGRDEATSVDTLRRNINALDQPFKEFRDNLRQSSAGLFVSFQEMTKYTQAYARASAESDAGRLSGGASTAVGFGRSYGMDPSVSARLFGQAGFLGMGGEHTTPKEMAVMFADAIAGGKMWAKADEVISAIIRYTETSERVMVRSPNIAGYIAQTAAMNAFGKDNNLPGLRGGAGASIIDRITSAIQSGGAAGEAGQNYIWRALGGGRNGLDPFQVQYALEEGPFGKAKGNDKTNLDLIMSRLASDQNYQDPMMRAAAGGRLMGLSMHQYEAMEKLRASGQIGKYNSLGDYLKDQNINLKSLSNTGILDMANISAAGRGGDQSLDALRKSFLNRKGLTEQERSNLDSAQGEELRGVLTRVSQRLGMERTVATDSLQVLVEIRNELTRVGSKLFPAETKAKGMFSTALGGFNEMTDPDLWKRLMTGFAGVAQPGGGLSLSIDVNHKDVNGVTTRTENHKLPLPDIMKPAASGTIQR